MALHILPINGQFILRLSATWLHKYPLADVKLLRQVRTISSSVVSEDSTIWNSLEFDGYSVETVVVEHFNGGEWDLDSIINGPCWQHDLVALWECESRNYFIFII